MKIINLYKADKNKIYQVINAPDGLLESMGVRSGVRVEIKNRYVLGGPVLLRVEDAYSIAIGKDVAKGIQVVAA